MSLANKLWAIGFAAISLFFGTCALFGYFPGESNGITMFAELSERFGSFETGLGTVLVGLILAIWTLFCRSGTASADAFDYDGGGDGGD
jgi:hypothetical protein